MEQTNNEKSLMKKTKQELVNIILRKDDVEKDYRTKLNSALENVNTLNDVVKQQSDLLIEREGIIDDFKLSFDLEADKTAMTVQDIKRLKRINGFLYVAICLLVIGFIIVSIF